MSVRYIQDILFRRATSTIFQSGVAVYVYVEDVIEAIIQALRRPEATRKRYLLGNECLNGKSYAQLIGEVAHVRLPWFHFPDQIVLAASHLFTWIAELLKRPPWWGLSIDAGRTLSVGFCFDGS